jgi:peptidase S41-like protein
MAKRKATKPGKGGAKRKSGEPPEAVAVAAAPALAATTTLRAFLASAGQLTRRERERLVDQALALLGQAYVHLPLKRAMHAVDPVQRLRLLRQRLAPMSERQFHDELIAIFTELRDLHTSYELPDPYQGKVAFLPFLVEEFFERSERRYMVTKLFADFDHPELVPGVVVTYWNGVPIDRAVELNAARQAGSNPDARHARGLEALTLRPMALSSPPDEEWVTVGFSDDDGDHEARIDWQVFEPDASPSGVDPRAVRDPSARALGVDARTEAVRRAKKHLFAPRALAAEREMAALRAGTAAKKADGRLDTESTLPDVLSFRPLVTPDGEFGYVRIWSFMVDDPDAFVAEFLRIIGLLPQDGLIVDVRGNGGGVITAGESLLQLLTPRRIEPERFHFVNTPLTLQLAEHNDFLSEWQDSIRQSVQTGDVYSQGFPIADADAYNQIGQQYHGPVVLVTDALCYSTTDIFTAGFADHGVGQILGTSGNTGAGGANVWTHELLREFLPKSGSPFGALPRNASFRVAIRRSTRVGSRSGVPVEDLGVAPSARHDMTRADLLEGNTDLIAAAVTLLAKGKPYGLAVELEPEGGVVKVVATTRGLDRLDVLVDGRPVTSVDVGDGANPIELAAPGPGAATLEVRGFDTGVLAAARRVPLAGG